ncbi:MAG: hypothetical protein JSV96_08945, partial [Candidatus Aminicenantes bacterium]
PLGAKRGAIRSAFKSACERFGPTTVAIIAPAIWLSSESYEKQPEDSYFRLKLPSGPPNPALAYMVRRASRDLRVTRGKFGKEHRNLVKKFLVRHELTSEQKYIFGRIGQYTKCSASACLLEARKEDALVAFIVVDVGSANYVFYLFCIRSADEMVPGATDLLFHEMIRLAESKGKSAINLGLGINPGNRRFKEKWGGSPFLQHNAALISSRSFEMGTLMKKL